MSKETKENESNNHEIFIKKTSLTFYLLIKEIENNKLLEASESKKIIDKIKKIDKDLLSHFKIKFSDKQKNEGYKFLELLKK
ncbi:hypothetical protein [Flavobacterium sp.]|uniref:hypothetical protein n=1 Tax=Flavobacterium sp. TaxID=239 RepID=UPI003753AFD0